MVNNKMEVSFGVFLFQMINEKKKIYVWEDISFLLYFIVFEGQVKQVIIFFFIVMKEFGFEV